MIRDVLAGGGFASLTGRSILEVGCGSGGVLQGLLEIGASAEFCHGIDLLPDRIEAAKLAVPGAKFNVANAESLSFSAAAFDLVIAFTVFSSILDRSVAKNVANEMDRVLKPGGCVLWYDLRRGNPWNPNVRGMSKAETLNLFRGYEGHFMSATLLPPLARHLGPLTNLLYPFFHSLPVLRTHLLALLRKPGGPRGKT